MATHSFWITKGIAEIADGIMEDMGVKTSDRKIVKGAITLAGGAWLATVTVDPAGGAMSIGDATQTITEALNQS